MKLAGRFMNTTYDAQIKDAIKTYLPETGWRLLKAQLTQESHLNPAATSPAGAQGIAQFMPKTWQDMQKELSIPQEITPYDESYAIPAAAYYMQKLCKSWSAPREEADRYILALASYNAGFGNILKAQALANNAPEYYPIISKLEHITGLSNSLETKHYVINILKIFSEYLTKGR